MQKYNTECKCESQLLWAVLNLGCSDGDPAKECHGDLEHYIEMIILCDLRTTTVSGKALTTDKTHHVITMLCVENLHVEVNMSVTL